jgi:hypothetical protein
MLRPHVCVKGVSLQLKQPGSWDWERLLDSTPDLNLTHQSMPETSFTKKCRGFPSTMSKDEKYCGKGDKLT